MRSQAFGGRLPVAGDMAALRSAIACSVQARKRAKVTSF